MLQDMLTVVLSSDVIVVTVRLGTAMLELLNTMLENRRTRRRSPPRPTDNTTCEFRR
jgi:hypothetical protein